jgi:hypothetical protein
MRLTQTAHNRPRRVDGIEINSLPHAAESGGGGSGSGGVPPTQDVRFLTVALHYSYMFENPLGDLTIERRWAGAFSQTCIEIDAALKSFSGTADQTSRNHGFCWRLMNAEDGQPDWMWMLGKEYEQRVMVEPVLGGEPQVVIAASNIDPADTLRQTIQAIVKRGQIRALNAGQLASNDAVFATGELQ